MNSWCIIGLMWDICSWEKRSLGRVWVTHLHHQGWENRGDPVSYGYSCSRSWSGMWKVPC